MLKLSLTSHLKHLKVINGLKEDVMEKQGMNLTLMPVFVINFNMGQNFYIENGMH